MFKSIKNRQKSIGKFFVSVFIVLTPLLTLSAPAYAQEGIQDPHNPSKCNIGNQEGVWLSIAVGGRHCIPNSTGTGVTGNVIFIYLKGIIQFLTGGAGILAVAGVVWGGITYATAQGNPGKIQKAITIIINASIGLVLFFLLAAIFNYLIPGGIFS